MDLYEIRKSVLTTAWHAKGTLPFIVSVTHRQQIPLLETHIPISQKIFSYEKGAMMDVLEGAFTYFNWVTNGRDGAAPDEVNFLAMLHNSHASMSVGDVVQVTAFAGSDVYRPHNWYFICTNFGWEEVTV